VSKRARGCRLPKIVVAEDNLGGAELLQILLRMEGHEVSTTPNATEVVGLLEVERPDLLIMDLYLGKYSGLDVLREIRQRPTIAGTAVIVVSGLEHSWEAEKAEADYFLLKPFGADELFAAMQQALAHRQSLAAPHRPENQI